VSERDATRGVRGAVADIGAVGIVVAALWWATAGFSVITSEGARRRAVSRVPVEIPPAATRSPDGAVVDVLAETDQATLGPTPRVAIVGFFYARCPGVCGILGESLQRVQQLVRVRGLGDQLRVLSISFDSTDTPDVLDRYRQTRRVDPQLWQLRTLAPGPSRDGLLRAFGVTVIPDGASGFQHNVALHVVLSDRRLIRVLDVDDAEGAVAVATAALGLGPVASR
jgi:protein SCO1